MGCSISSDCQRGEDPKQPSESEASIVLVSKGVIQPPILQNKIPNALDEQSTKLFVDFTLLEQLLFSICDGNHDNVAKLVGSCDLNRVLALYGVSPFHVACRIRNEELVRLLLPHSKINVADERGKTSAWHVAHQLFWLTRSRAVFRNLQSASSSDANSLWPENPTVRKLENVLDALITAECNLYAEEGTTARKIQESIHMKWDLKLKKVTIFVAKLSEPQEKVQQYIDTLKKMKVIKKDTEVLVKDQSVLLSFPRARRALLFLQKWIQCESAQVPTFLPPNQGAASCDPFYSSSPASILLAALDRSADLFSAVQGHSRFDLASAIALRQRWRQPADVLAADQFGRTLLHWAAWRGDTAACLDLLARGVNPRAEDQLGQTALHLAAAACHFDAVGCLLSADESLAVLLDFRLRTPLELAAERLRRILWISRRRARLTSAAATTAAASAATQEPRSESSGPRSLRPGDAEVAAAEATVLALIRAWRAAGARGARDCRIGLRLAQARGEDVLAVGLVKTGPAETRAALRELVAPHAGKRAGAADAAVEQDEDGEVRVRLPMHGRLAVMTALRADWRARQALFVTPGGAAPAVGDGGGDELKLDEGVLEQLRGVLDEEVDLWDVCQGRHGGLTLGEAVGLYETWGLPADWAGVDAGGRTLLHWAAWRGDAGACRLLVGAGADVLAVDQAGLSDGCDDYFFFSMA